MKKEFLQYLIRECVKEVLEAFPQEPETVGAPAPPAAGQGTADQPALPQQAPPTLSAPPLPTTAKGVFYVDPKKPQKPMPLQLSSPQDPGKLERELYRTAARSGGPRVKVSSAALREVPRVIASPNTAMFLYIGKQNPEDPDTELYLLPAKTLQQAQQASVPAGVSAEHPTTVPTPQEPGMETPQQGPADAKKTQAPDIDENSSGRNMLSGMIRECIREMKK
jgi:hypothetical protein